MKMQDLTGVIFNTKEDKQYIQACLATASLSKQDEYKLVGLIHNGSKKEREFATEKLVAAHMKSVIRIAYNNKDCGVDFMDLVSEGSLGLLEGIKKFDTSYDSHLGSYASYWITQRIGRYIQNGDVVRIPVHVHEKISDMEAKMDILAQKLGRFPSNLEIAKAMNISVDEVELLRKTAFGAEAARSQWFSEECNDIINKISENNYIIGGEMTNPEDVVDAREVRDAMNKVLGTITAKEKKVMEMRYGFYDGTEHTLEEVGKEFGVTRERIRQIQARALRKLRHPAHSRPLRGLMNA